MAFKRSNDDCGRGVADAWQGGAGEQMQCRVSRVELSTWVAFTFRAIKKKMKDIEKRSHDLKMGRMDGHLLEQCNNIKNEINELRRRKESYWYSWARNNELRDGDKNTKYFHHKASQQRNRNFIVGLDNEHRE
ncbi:uncharacterized protein LOC110697332 [Chenopodium quinoa]|uniref:uncharacterized protein LOC110697332 n=1 Tax=Chenopodium quinoa TaxID=63459 RepID=UPI000B79333D|nr:uncharacterized protein LOC110697332 [Chenopodium quinoa]